MKIGEITVCLEQIYDALNQRFFNGELPPVVITVQSSPRAYGHFTVREVWKDGNAKGFHEINIGAETLSRPLVETCGTLIHEMTHFYCQLHNIKSTSRNNFYHNFRFKEEAEKHGVIIGYDPRIGHSPTTPSEELYEFVEQQGWQDIDLSRNNGFFIGGSGSNGSNGADGENGVEKKKSNQRKYQCPKCKCSCRATSVLHIKCIPCDLEMVEVIKNDN